MFNFQLFHTAVREDYLTWFNDYGVDRVDVALLDGGMLGNEHTFMINEHTFYDKDGNAIGSFK